MSSSRLRGRAFIEAAHPLPALDFLGVLLLGVRVGLVLKLSMPIATSPLMGAFVTVVVVIPVDVVVAVVPPPQPARAKVLTRAAAAKRRRRTREDYLSRHDVPRKEDHNGLFLKSRVFSNYSVFLMNAVFVS